MADQHVEVIHTLQSRANQRVGHHQRIMERVARQVGRPRSIYVLLVVVSAWMILNLELAKPIDPSPFFGLQGLLGLYAALVTTIVLTVQNRVQREGEHKSSLELQVNLAAEHKTAKIIQLLEELRRDMPNVHNRRDTQAEALSRAVDTHAVIDALEESLERPSNVAP